MAITLDGTNGITTPEIVSSGGPLVVDSGAPDNSVVVNSAGNLKAVATIAVGNATPSTSGAGITFPATASASSDANTLDDYEEGTFTPTIVGGTTTYTTQSGNYTKIGRVITVTVKVAYSAATGTGTLSIGNFPFAAASGEHVGSVMEDNLNMPSAGSYSLYINNTQTSAQIYTSTDDGAISATQLSNESATIWATITYFTS